MQTAGEMASAVRDGSLKASAIAESMLAHIDQLEPQLQAWVEVDRAGVIQAARAQVAGPLAGVPVGVKDIIDVAGLPTRLGAAPFAHRIPSQDAIAVARLRAAGALIAGKTHTTQFAYLDPAPTCNPWNLERTPGGSSSGSAAAVAAGMVSLALGSQTVGSVLRPAAYCGVVGLKPTYGLIPYEGTAHLAPSFDHIGVLCRCVADAALALEVLAGPRPVEFGSTSASVDYVTALQESRPPRLGLARRFYTGVANDEVTRHLDDVARRLTNAGAAVQEADLPATARETADMGQPVLRAEAAHVHRAAFEAHKDEYAADIRSLVESGLATQAVDYLQAQAVLRQLRASLVWLLEGFDACLMPVAPSTAPGRETTGNSVFCAAASFTGLPAIALPSGLGEDGLPLSVQLIAAPYAEAKLLGVAAWIERVFDFKARPPLAPA